MNAANPNMTTAYTTKRSNIYVHHLIYYHDIIHEVKETCHPFFQILPFDCDKPKPFRIYQNDPSIRPIFKDIQEQIKKAYHFKTRYNKEIDVLNEHSPRPFQKVSLQFLIEYSIHKRYISLKLFNKLPFILKKTGSHSIEIQNILSNPMDFILPEFQFISFRKALEISIELGLHIDLTIQIEKWCYDFMHTHRCFYIPFHKFIDRFKEFCLSIHTKYEDVIDIMNQSTVHKTIHGQHYRTTQPLIDAENILTNHIIELFYNKQFAISRQTIQTHISAFESIHQITFNSQQLDAIHGAICNKLFTINGFPGTGKSTIVKCILYVFSVISKKEELIDQEEDVEYILTAKYPTRSKISILAPTGLAYVGLSAKCRPLFNETISGTCHRVVYTQFDKKMPEKPELIIIDEFSMIDIFMLREIIDWCIIFQCRLIIIGDENQLPSIGPGTCLKNIIQCNIFSQTKLTQIKRQNSDCLLIQHIQTMTEKVLLPCQLTDHTLQLLPIQRFIQEGELSIHQIRELFRHEQFNCNNTKILTYFKDAKYICNMNNLNSIFQDLFNPNGKIISSSSSSKYTKKTEIYQYKVGDHIIRIENDYSNEHFRANGECAIIQRVDVIKQTVYIRYHDAKEDIEVHIATLYEEFSLAYALTVHKSQGSQCENVVIFIDETQHSWNKTALYTAISRAQSRCILITTDRDFISIQKNIRGNEDKQSLFMLESSIYDI